MPNVNYSSVDEVYKKLFRELTDFARRNLINRDNAVDAVHEAFVHVVEWKAAHPDEYINPKIVYGQVLRACRRINRHDPQHLSLDDPQNAGYFRSV